MKLKTTFSILILTWAANAAAAETTLDQLKSVCAAEQYQFTPKVRAAYLALAREDAVAELKAEGKSLPTEFLDWVDATPQVAAGVYGAHHKPSDVLQHLFALRLDLGKEPFEKYEQLMVAQALVETKLGKAADISPRPPIKLTIGGDPRIPIDTKEPGRKLDQNDHIINFLNDHTIEEEVVVGAKEAILKYDDRGIAIPAKKKKGEKGIKEKRTRSLYASDVIASETLQKKFNAYMKERGFDLRINCGDRVLHWNSKDMVRGQQYKDIERAYRMFRAAYEAKGLLPEARDPFPSAAEKCAYLIRNHEYQFTPELQKDRQWPRFPLNASWPLLTMLALNNQPLREREERWIAFRDRGELKKYGEYIGGVAQQFPMQSARRLKPYPFSYNTIQMMLKDGGVCGTMASISERTHTSLGIPSAQATQPGHCAMVAFHHDKKTGMYSCKGGQYAGAGDEKTGPFTPWPFVEKTRRRRRTSGHEISFNERKPMVYHQSLAWGANYGAEAYMDATLAHALYQQLPEAVQKTHGLSLLESGLDRNPYQFLLIDAALALADTPEKQVAVWSRFQTRLEQVDKPGCPKDGLFNQTVKTSLFTRLEKLPVPTNQDAARRIHAFLKQEQCDRKPLLAKYDKALKAELKP